MHEVLIALKDDLASRIALRYAKQLETADRFNMQAIHIPEFNGSGSAPGSGWVREKWENAVTKENQEGISELVKSEYVYHFSDSGLKTLSGPRDQEILGELEEKPYDFFIEGQFHSFEPEPFMAKLSTRLYRNLACPALLVKNLADPGLGTLILYEAETQPPPASGWFTRLLSDLPGPLDMLSCRFRTRKTAALNSGGKKPGLSREPAAPPPGAWESLNQVLSGQGTPEELAEVAGDYALVVAPLPEPGSPMARMLAAVSTAVLLCPAPAPKEDKEV